MREGWGITHDYIKDFKNLWKAHEALEKGEKNVENSFEKGT